MPSKRYVCTSCGKEHLALPCGGYCEKCKLPTLRAALICECGQWAWPHMYPDDDPRHPGVYYRCVNDHYGGRIFHDDK